jgi:hypothetical protein
MHLTRFARPSQFATAVIAAAVFLAPHPAQARGGGDCEYPMHFTEISSIKCDHFGTKSSPWLNVIAEWKGAPTSCLLVDFPGQDPGFNAGTGFLATGSGFPDDKVPYDTIVVELNTGTIQAGNSTVTSSTGGCTLRFSVDVVFHAGPSVFEDASWSYLVDDAPLVDRQRIPAGTHVFEWRLKGDADLARLCPPPCQLFISNMPFFRFSQYVDPVCVGDLDDDGVVGASDLAILLSFWGNAATGVADLDGDGLTGATDLSILLSNWGDCA